MLTLDKVYQASQVLREVIRETDMILAPNIHPGTNVYLKTENLQVTGSFKIRGSYYKISKLTDVMTQVLSDSKPGDTIKLTIARIENNQIKTFKVDCKLIESKGN